MNKTSKQLETVFQEITSSFADTPDVIVTPGEGSPPDEYTVTYHKTGACKENGGAVTTCDTHIISISLPFGFPHFPPNCLPKSGTFHPDFDSSAICIDDAWEADKSITNLILHIGRMISGEIYSMDSVFNEEAAEWYKANSSSLPFGGTDSQQAPATPAAAVSEKDTFDSIDTLDDGDFGETFSLGQETEVPPDVDADIMRVMVSNRRFHALSQELQKNNEPFDGRTTLEEQTQSALNKAEALLHEVEKLEHLGVHQEALEKISAIEAVVADYPGIQKAQERIQWSLDLLEKEANETQDDSAVPESSAIKADKKTFFKDKKRLSRKGISLVLGGVFIVLTTALTFSYFFLGSSMKKAEEHYVKCQRLLDSGKFKGAEQQCQKALELAAEVRIVKQDAKKQLTGNIQTLLNSPKLRQGLAGKTLLDGKYVSQASRESIQTFMEAKTNGDTFFAEERWQDATNSYDTALAMAKNADINENLLAEILKKQPYARFNTFKQAAEKALVQSDWDTATKHFDEALKFAKASPDFPLQEIHQLELLAKQTKFEALRQHAQHLFQENDWKAALDSYQRALALAIKLDLNESYNISQLRENIALSKIYLAIAKGKEAFATAQWDTVIAQYEEAIILLEENATLLSATNIEESGEKLARIMLHTTIIRDKQNVAKHLQADDFNQAIKQLQTTKQTISNSPFADRPKFQTILKEITLQLHETEQQFIIVTQTAYLTENYKKLFLKHYPATARAALSKPRVEYLKNLGNDLLFRMKCTETSGGRPLRLQMDYRYSPANARWQFYSEAE